MSKGFEDWTEEDVKKFNARSKYKGAGAIFDLHQNMNKYRNEKVVVNGVKFDSKKEAKRSAELEQLERLGVISNLEKQKKYVLQPSFKFMGKTIREIAYLADFVYKENGNTVVEDVKSPITRKNPVYRLKKKMMMYIHGIDIREV